MTYTIKANIKLSNKDTTNYVSCIDTNENGFIIRRLDIDVNQITIYKKEINNKIKKTKDFNMRLESNQSPEKPVE